MKPREKVIPKPDRVKTVLFRNDGTFNKLLWVIEVFSSIDADFDRFQNGFARDPSALNFSYKRFWAEKNLARSQRENKVPNTLLGKI